MSETKSSQTVAQLVKILYNSKDKTLSFIYKLDILSRGPS